MVYIDRIRLTAVQIQMQISMYSCYDEYCMYVWRHPASSLGCSSSELCLTPISLSEDEIGNSLYNS